MNQHIRGNNLIIEKDEIKSKEKHKTYWKVQCLICGKIRSIRDDNIYQSCMSCAAKNRKTSNIIDDLTGRTFGYWYVLNKSKRPNYWHCICTNCSTERDVFRGNLINNTSKSCGCIKSWGETQITYILNQNNINYKKEYMFPDLKTEKGGNPRFDFAIFDDNEQLLYLIEYDGRQHYSYEKNWSLSEKDFKYLQKTDVLKNQYCKDNNITLFRFNSKSNLKEELEAIINSNKGLTK